MPKITSLKRTNSSPRETILKRSNDVTLVPGLNESRLNEVGGIVLICGQGDCGQLGLGEDVLEKTKPFVIPDLTNVVEIAAGAMHTVCVNNTGKVFSWGCNDEGALGRDTSVEGSECIPGDVSLPEKIIQVTAGDSHSTALTESGKVYAWGSFRDSHGSMGLTMNGNERLPILLSENIAKVASGSDHLLLLSRNGVMYTCGCAEQGQLGRIAERFVGRDTRQGIERLLIPRPITFYPRIKHKFDQVWSGAYHTFLREYNSGHIYSCGLNNHYQLGLIEDRVYYKPALVESFDPYKPWLKVSGGQHHTVAVNNEGVTFALGRREYGRLGLGENCDDSQVPTIIPNLERKKVIDVSCSSNVSFAVTADGEVYGWGMGTNHQLGFGNEDDVYEPKIITGKHLQPNSVLKVSSGGQHAVFLCKPNPP